MGEHEEKPELAEELESGVDEALEEESEHTDDKQEQMACKSSKSQEASKSQ